jgi:hypothetical protein
LHLHVVLCRHQLALNRLDSLIQVVLQVRLVIDCFLLCSGLVALQVFDVILQLLYLFLVLLYDLLAEVGTLGELGLDFLVVCQVPCKLGNALLPLLVLVHEMFGLHRLVFQLASELHVLYNRQLCCTDQLIFVHVQHLDLDCPDLEQHLLAKRVNLLNFFLLNLLYYLGLSLRLPVKLKLSLLFEIDELHFQN